MTHTRIMGHRKSGQVDGAGEEQRKGGKCVERHWVAQGEPWGSLSGTGVPGLQRELSDHCWSTWAGRGWTGGRCHRTLRLCPKGSHTLHIQCIHTHTYCTQGHVSVSCAWDQLGVIHPEPASPPGHPLHVCEVSPPAVSSVTVRDPHGVHTVILVPILDSTLPVSAQPCREKDLPQGMSPRHRAFALHEMGQNRQNLTASMKETCGHLFLERGHTQGWCTGTSACGQEGGGCSQAAFSEGWGGVEETSGWHPSNGLGRNPSP